MKYILVASFITASVLIVGTTLNAHENATGIVERMLVMEDRQVNEGNHDNDMTVAPSVMIGRGQRLARNLADPEVPILQNYIKSLHSLKRLWSDWERFSALA